METQGRAKGLTDRERALLTLAAKNEHVETADSDFYSGGLHGLVTSIEGGQGGWLDDFQTSRWAITALGREVYAALPPPPEGK